MFELLIIALLLLANGVFAMTEMALVSIKRSRLKARIATGDKRAIATLALIQNPNAVLSTTQLGITLIGILSGAFSGEHFISILEPKLLMFGDLAHPLALFIVVGTLTFASVIIGEIVPKRIALNHPEFIALWMTQPMYWLGRIGRPFVVVLSMSTDLILRLFFIKPASEPAINDEELSSLLHEGYRVGAFHEQERNLLSRVLELDSLTATDLMTPRAQVVCLHVGDTAEHIRRKIATCPYTNYPLLDAQGRHIGIIPLKELVTALSQTTLPDLTKLAKPALTVNESDSAYVLLSRFQSDSRHVALVINANGNMVGLLVVLDLFEALAGTINESERQKPKALTRIDGTLLVDGAMSISQAQKLVNPNIPAAPERYQTLSGYLLTETQDIPTEGLIIHTPLFLAEIMDMDGPSVDKVLIKPLPSTDANE